jgi:predicted phage terminase large subunit-like protein
MAILSGPRYADEERYFNNLHKLEYATDSQIKDLTHGEDMTIVVDPAPSDKKSKKRGRDYTVIAAGTKVDGKYVLTDAVRFREDLEYQVNEIFKMWAKWQPKTIWIEDFGAQTYLLQATQMEARKRGLWISIRGTKDMELNHKGKHPRIQNLKPIIAERRLILPMCHDVLSSVLHDELYAYDKGRHDDVADAASYFPLILKGNDGRDFNYEDLVGPTALT